MPALLALVPVKDWVYVGIIAGLLATFGWYTFHERAVGEKKIEAADAKVAAAQVVHDQEVQDVVKSKLADALKDYELAPVVPVAAAIPKLMCYASDSGAVPGGTSSVTAGDGTGAAVPAAAAAADEGFDPAPALSADGLDADKEILRLKAKVTLLQQTVSAYQDAGLVAKR
jgi:hypothetical protein